MLTNDQNNFISKKEIKEKGLYSISFRRRLVKNTIWLILLLMSISLLIPLFSLVFTFLSRGLPVVLKDFPSYFVTRTKGDPTSLVYGLQNAAWGSILVTAVASIISIPLGLAIGIYLSNNSEGLFVNFVRLMADVLQSIPSIIAGVVVLEFFVIPHGTSGYGYIAGGIAMSILMIPIIARTSEEGIRTIPTNMYEAAMSLGLPEWRISLNIIINSARPVIMTGIFLAVARIMGETAPLIVTAGDNDFYVTNGSTPLATLTMKIYTYAITGYSKTWIPSAYGMALVLMMFILTVSILIRTDILERLSSHLTFKLILWQLIIIFFVVSFSFLFDATLLFLVFAGLLKYLVFNVLSENDLFYKFWNKVIGKLIVIIVVLDIFVELIIYYLGFLNKYIYDVNFFVSSMLFLGLALYYSNKYIRVPTTDLDKVRILLVVTVGLLLIRLGFYGFFYNFFNETFVFFSIFILLKLVAFTIYRNNRSLNQVWEQFSGKLIVLTLVIESAIEAILYFVGTIVNSVNTYLFYVDLAFSGIFTFILIFYFANWYIRNSTNQNTQNSTTTEQKVRNLITITLGFLMLVLTFNSVNSFIVYVFLTSLILRFIIWFVFVKERLVYSLWNNSFGKIVIYLECLEVIIQTAMLFTPATADIVYQINYPLSYLLGPIILVYFFIKYLHDLRNLAERVRIFIFLFFAICILQLVDPSLILVNIGITYTQAYDLFSQFAFGLLLKTVILYMLISSNYFTTLWKSNIGKALVVLVALETIMEFTALILGLSTSIAMTLVMTMNGLMIYFIILFYLIVVIFKFDVLNKILVKNVN